MNQSQEHVLIAESLKRGFGIQEHEKGSPRSPNERSFGFREDFD